MSLTSQCTRSSRNLSRSSSMRSAAFSNRSHNDWHKPASTDGAFSDLICGAKSRIARTPAIAPPTHPVTTRKPNPSTSQPCPISLGVSFAERLAVAHPFDHPRAPGLGLNPIVERRQQLLQWFPGPRDTEANTQYDKACHCSQMRNPAVIHAGEYQTKRGKHNYRTQVIKAYERPDVARG